MTLFEALKGKTIVNTYDGRPDGSVLIRLNDRTEIVIYDGTIDVFDNPMIVIERLGV